MKRNAPAIDAAIARAEASRLAKHPKRNSPSTLKTPEANRKEDPEQLYLGAEEDLANRADLLDEIECLAAAHPQTTDDPVQVSTCAQVPVRPRARVAAQKAKAKMAMMK